MTKHDLKELAAIGAELGAAKAENERLRGLLEAALYYVPSNKTELRALIDAALEHSCKNCEGVQPESCMFARQAEPTDTFTAVDMATAAAQGFRDGQAAVEQAAVQDELPAGGVTIEKDIFGTVHIKMGDFDYIQIQYQYPYTDNASQNALAKRIAELLTRPAQTAPQPEQSALVLPRAQLERIERRLTDWLELNCCECESGHLCWRNEVTADRDAIRAALSAQGGQQ